MTIILVFAALLIVVTTTLLIYAWRRYAKKDAFLPSEKPSAEFPVFAPKMSAPSSVEDIDIPAGVFFGKGHTWASIEPEGLVRIGVDDFLTKLLGAAHAVEIQAVNSPIRRGKPVFSIFRNKRKFSFYTPFEGYVQSANDAVLENPSLVFAEPYNAWIVKIKPVGLSNSIKWTYIAEGAYHWMRQEIVRLRDFLTSAYSASSDTTETTLADGGQILEDALQKLDDEGWEKLQKEFLEDF